MRKKNLPSTSLPSPPPPQRTTSNSPLSDTSNLVQTFQLNHNIRTSAPISKPTVEQKQNSVRYTRKLSTVIRANQESNAQISGSAAVLQNDMCILVSATSNPTAMPSSVDTMNITSSPSIDQHVITKFQTKPSYPKPAYSYPCLIAMALKNSRYGSLRFYVRTFSILQNGTERLEVCRTTTIMEQQMLFKN